MMTPHQSSAYSLLQQDLSKTIKLSAKLRRLVDRRLGQIEQLMKDPTTPGPKLRQASEELTKYLSVCADTITNASKLLLSAKHAPPADPNASAGQIMEELTSGRTLRIVSPPRRAEVAAAAQ